jgi:hypothetical protein
MIRRHYASPGSWLVADRRLFARQLTLINRGVPNVIDEMSESLSTLKMIMGQENRLIRLSRVLIHLLP